MSFEISKKHPRYSSLRYRHKLIDGLKEGYVTEAGLIAHGRGEAFDYLLGERTVSYAYEAERAAVALLLLAEHPVISVNGNVAALVSREIVKLAKLIPASLEINLFYWTREREVLIEKVLKKAGAEKVFGTNAQQKIELPGIASHRAWVDKMGIAKADVCMVALEDGDRTEALKSIGKKVIAIDLNPLSRTAQNADISICDNIVRAVPNMINMVKEMKEWDKNMLKKLVKDFDNRKNLESSLLLIRKGVLV